MMSLFRGIKTAYFLTVFGGMLCGAVLAGWLGLTEASSPFAVLLTVPLAFIWVFVVAFAYQVLAAKKAKKITDRTLNVCKIRDYILINQSWLKKSTVRTIRTVLLMNQSTGYLSMGAASEAKQVLDGIGGFRNTRADAVGRAVYWNNLAAYYLAVQDPENAADCLAEMNRALENQKLRSRNRTLLFHAWSDKQFLLNMENGNYEGCEQVFLIALEREKKPLGKVFAQYTLGRIYLHENKSAEARQAFAYAAENGGDSVYAAQARFFLQQMNREAGAEPA